MHVPRGLAAAAVVLALAGIVSPLQGGTPNVVLVLADDMGYADLKAFNPDSKIPTPALDKLAAEGMRFTDFHTTGSTCIPARFGLMTGTYPFRQPDMRDKKPLIPEGMPTLASLLKTAGYDTVMVGKWHLGFDDKNNPKKDKPLLGGPLDRGFDSFYGIHASTDIPPYYYIEGRLPQGMPMRQIEAHADDRETTGWTNIQGAFWRGGGIGQDLELPEVTPRLFDKAVAFLADRKPEANPFLLYLALPSPHTPWLPTEEFVGKSGAGSYGDFLMTIDHGIGRVLQQLEASGLAGESLVLFTSDNGPVWYAKDTETFSHSSTGPLRGMKGDNWEGGHRMPLIARLPGRIPAGETSGALASFLDVSATLCALAGVEDDIPADSISFLPTLLGEENPSPRTSLVHGKGKSMTLRDGRWKLLDHQGSAGFSRAQSPKPLPTDPPGQLYDLEADLGETENLWTKHPEIVDRMRKDLRGRLGR